MDGSENVWIIPSTVNNSYNTGGHLLRYCCVLTGDADDEKYDKRTVARYHSVRGQQKQLEGDEGATRIYCKTSRGLSKYLHRRAEGDLLKVPRLPG